MSGSDDVTQTTQPPRYVKPFIQDVLQQGQSLYNNFTPQYFPGSTVAPLSPYTAQATDQLAGFGGSSFNQGNIASGLQGIDTLLGPNYAQAYGGMSLPGNTQFLTGAQNRANNPAQFGPLPSQGLSQIDPTAALQASMFNQRDVNQNLQTGPQTGAEAAAGNINTAPLTADPASNPYIRQIIERAQAQTLQDFQQNVLPSIQNQQEAVGGFGGSRQGVAEGIGLQGVADANADIAAQILYDSYNQDLARQQNLLGLGTQADLNRRGIGLQQEALNQNVAGQDLARNLQGATAAGQLGLSGDQLGLQSFLGQGQLANQQFGQGLQATADLNNLYNSGTNQAIQGAATGVGLLPSVQQMGLFGTNALLQAGDIDNAYRQALLQDEVNRFNFTQAQPYNALNQYINAVYGLPGLGGSSTSVPTSSGGFAGALGGAASAAGLAGALNSFGPGLGAAAGPVGWTLTGLGALLGAFG